MSEYFRVLKRLERDEPTPGLTLATAPPRRPREVGQTGAKGPSTASANAPLVFGALLDAVRTLLPDAPTLRLVIAAATEPDRAAAVADGLAAHAASIGLRVSITHIADEGGHLVLKQADGSHCGESLGLDWRARADREAVRSWLADATAGADLALIAGPPLSRSVDAALLAGAANGLLLVAESEVTPREALARAADRSRSAGCRVLGVVLWGTRDYLPAWLRRLVPARAISRSEEKP